MTDFLNPHRISANYPIVNRAGEIQTGRIDIAPGFDSRGIKPMEYKSARIAEDDLPVGATVKESLTVLTDVDGEIVGFCTKEESK